MITDGEAVDEMRFRGVDSGGFSRKLWRDEGSSMFRFEAVGRKAEGWVENATLGGAYKDRPA